MPGTNPGDVSKSPLASREGGSALDAMGRQGWFGLAGWMVFGLLLEGLLAYKTPAYLNDPQRRELFRLAHSHGSLLSLFLIVAALWAQRSSPGPRRIVRLALRCGTVLMPAGFLLAGMWHFESDPGLAIWLVPGGAILVIFGTLTFAFRRAGP